MGKGKKYDGIQIKISKKKKKKTKYSFFKCLIF